MIVISETIVVPNKSLHRQRDGGCKEPSSRGPAANTAAWANSPDWDVWLFVVISRFRKWDADRIPSLVAT
jgi:hypothetical protein